MLAHAGGIANEARIAAQDRIVGVLNLGIVGQRLVMRRPRQGRAQIAHPPAGGIDHDHILVGMGLLLATVMNDLFGRVFGARPWPALDRKSVV